MCNFKMSLDDAARIARDYVIEHTGYHPTLKDCKAYIMDARDGATKSAEWFDEHNEWPRYRDIDTSWDRAHATNIYKRKDGYPYCCLAQVVADRDLAFPEGYRR